MIPIQGYRTMKELISSTIPSIANNNILSEGGVIYLPFQISIFTEIVAHYNILRKKYSISFIERTPNNTLWSCTHKIKATEMQDVFEKRIDQVEQYCTITVQEIKQNGLSNVVRTDDLLEIFHRINNPENIRFIQLIFAKGDNVPLGYAGLLRKPQSATKSSTKRKTNTKQPLVPNKKQCYIPTRTRQNLKQYIDQNWPTGNDTKDEFCHGIHRVLDIESVSCTKTIPKIVCEEESMQDDVRSILDIVKQKFQNTSVQS